MSRSAQTRCFARIALDFTRLAIRLPRLARVRGAAVVRQADALMPKRSLKARAKALAEPKPFSRAISRMSARGRRARFRAAYAKAEIVTPDGFPIVAFARMEGVSLERATGADPD